MVYTDFDGTYFVSYVDISGFKSILKKGITHAREALEYFYDSPFPKLRHNDTVQCFFVSDCAILFVRDEDSTINQFTYLLEVIEEMNKNMIANDYLLTSSIAYGDFHYKSFDDSSRVQRAVVFGLAYLETYLDNEVGNPKLLPGLCRVLKEGLPQAVVDFLQNEMSDLSSASIRKFMETETHYYYYWMLTRGTLKGFQEKYEEASQKIYFNYKKLIKDYLDI